MSTIVKVVITGSRINEYEVSNNPTLAGLKAMIEEANDDGRVLNGTFTRNGMTLTDGSGLQNGNILYYAEKLKGNQVMVKVIRVGSPINDVAVEHGSTIRQALEILPDEVQDEIFDGSGNTSYEVRIGDSAPMGLDATIPEPATSSDTVRLILTKKIKGNE